MLLAALVSAVMLSSSSSSSSSLEHAIVCCPASCPCIFPVDHLRVQEHDGDGQLCAAGPIGTTLA